MDPYGRVVARLGIGQEQGVLDSGLPVALVADALMRAGASMIPHDPGGVVLPGSWPWLVARQPQIRLTGNGGAFLHNRFVCVVGPQARQIEMNSQRCGMPIRQPDGSS